MLHMTFDGHPTLKCNPLDMLYGRNPSYPEQPLDLYVPAAHVAHVAHTVSLNVVHSSVTYLLSPH